MPKKQTGKSKALEQLFKEIDAKNIKLTKEEQNKLLEEFVPLRKLDNPTAAQKARREEIRETLIYGNIPWVTELTMQNIHKGVDIEDLFHEGVRGLEKAIDTYELGKNSSLAYWASYWIKTEQRIAIAKNAPIMKIPVNMYDKISKIYVEVLRIAGEKGIEPDDVTPEEVAANLGMDVEKVRELNKIGKTKNGVQLDPNIPDDKPLINGDVKIDDEAGSTLMRQYDMSDLKRQDEEEGIIAFLETIKKILQPKEYEFVKMRWGLREDGTLRKAMTLEEISQIYYEDRKVSREFIRQIQDKIIKRLQTKMSREELIDFVKAATQN